MISKYKDSGIEWIGEIPEDWSINRTKHFFTHHKDIVGENSNLFDRLALTLKGVIKRSKDDSKGLQPEAFNSYQILRKNDLVFKLIDLENISTSRVGLCPFIEGIVSPAYIILTPNDKIYPKYGEYYYLSMWHREIFNHLGDDGVRSSLNVNDLLNIPILIINKEEQQKIAEFLDEKCSHIDSVLDKTKASIEEYKKLKQAVITQAVTKGIRPNRPMKDSGIEWIGEIPEDWEKIKLKYITTISRGLFNHRPRNDERYYNGNYPFIQTGDVARAQKYITTYTQTLNELGKSVSKMFPKGTMTMTIAANIGDVAILGFDAYFPDSLVGFKIKEQFTENYVYYILRALKEQFMITAVANTQLNLNIERIKDVFVPVTYNKMEQEKIANYLDDKCAEIDKLITKKEQLIEELETYKKSLIYEYVTGKKEVC